VLAVSAGLTTATLLIVRQRVRSQVREAIRIDLQSSVNAYEIFDKQRQAAATQSARLIANLPYLRALMTTRDPATIADGALGIWKLSGSDLLVLADRSGKMLAVRSHTPDASAGASQPQVRRALELERTTDSWLAGEHLYHVWIQPIYFGESSENNITGYLAVGYEINDRTAQDFRSVGSSEVVFRTAGRVIAGTLDTAGRLEFRNSDAGAAVGPSADPREVELGSERFLMATLPLPCGSLVWATRLPPLPQSHPAVSSSSSATKLLSRMSWPSKLAPSCSSPTRILSFTTFFLSSMASASTLVYTKPVPATPCASIAQASAISSATSIRK
jgi:hypothetical protein